MVKFILYLLGIAAAGFLVQLQFPWWSIAVLAAIAGAFTGFGTGRNFLLGFLSVFILWAGYAFWLDAGNEGILSARVAVLFSVGASTLPLISGLIGGLVGGLAAAAGGLGSKLFE
jgi:hypothetical protein